MQYGGLYIKNKTKSKFTRTCLFHYLESVSFLGLDVKDVDLV